MIECYKLKIIFLLSFASHVGTSFIVPTNVRRLMKNGGTEKPFPPYLLFSRDFAILTQLSCTLCGAPSRIFPFSEHPWIFISDCRFV